MEPFLGQIQPFGFNFPPRGWTHCDGQILPIAQNTALFSLLGTTFGGDGRTTFGLPDIRGRSIRHVGNGPGLSSVSWGERGGSNTKTLSGANIAGHNHPVNVPVSTAVGSEATPAGNYIAGHTGAFNEDPTASQNLAAFNSGNNSGGTAFNVDNPFIGIYYSIALQGVFPSRN